MTKKIKINKTQRTLIDEYGVKHIQSTIDRIAEEKLYQAILDGANQAIRAKYPEGEMIILRKYELTRIDRCPRFLFPSERVDGFHFRFESPIADMPSQRGCYSGEAFPVSAAFEKAFDEHAKLKKENDKIEADTVQSFRSFLVACVYLDDILEVIDLPNEIRARLGHRSTGLIAVTAETVAALRTTFQQAA